MTIVIAADPGLSGAIAAVCSQRGLLEHANLPTCDNGAGKSASIRRKIDAVELRRLIGFWRIRHDMARDHIRIVIERMSSFGAGDKAPPASLLSMGFSAGIIEGVLSGVADEPIISVVPRAWKAHYQLGNDKAASVAAAQRLFPTAGRIRHDVAEAILLAAWGLADLRGDVAPTAPPKARQRARIQAAAASEPDPFAAGAP